MLNDCFRGLPVVLYLLYTKVGNWTKPTPRKLPVILTHDLLLAGHILPSGEQIERGREKKARAEAGRRALQAPDLVDFPGIGSQASRKADCQLTRAGLVWADSNIELLPNPGCR